MKKFGVKLLSVVVTSSMIVTPVMAAPSVKDLKQNKKAAQKQVDSLQTGPMSASIFRSATF